MAFTYTGEMVDLGFGRGWLSRPAAESIRRIDRQIGHPMQITEAGRTWGRQDEHWRKYLRDGWPIALNPDTPSEHQKGLSIDSDEAQRIIAILEDHGWRRTVYRWVRGLWTLVEPWHFEYFAHLDNHRSTSGGGATQGDDMPSEDWLNGMGASIVQQIKADLATIHNTVIAGNTSNAAALAAIRADINYIHTVSPVSLKAILEASRNGEIKLTDAQAKAIGGQLAATSVAGIDAALKDDFDGVKALLAQLPKATIAALKSAL